MSRTEGIVVDRPSRPSPRPPVAARALRVLLVVGLAVAGLLVPATASQAAEQATICLFSPVPAGWAVTQKTTVPNCPPASNLSSESTNAYVVRNLAVEQKGAVVGICEWQSVPAGWVATGKWIALDCGRSLFGWYELTMITKVVDGPVVIPPKPVVVGPEHDPVGHLDVVRSPQPNRVRVTGWAADRDQPTSPVTIRIWQGSTLIGQTVAGINRPDVAMAYPSLGAYHGFTLGMTVAKGPITVCVNAVNLGLGRNVRLGCGSTTVL